MNNKVEFQKLLMNQFYQMNIQPNKKRNRNNNKHIILVS